MISDWSLRLILWAGCLALFLVVPLLYWYSCLNPVAESQDDRQTEGKAE